MNVILLLVILLTILTCARLMKVFDLSARLRGKEPYEISETENNINAAMVLISLVGLFGMFFYLNGKYYSKDMIPLASKHGEEVNDLLHINFLVITLAFLITQVLLMWFAYRYRYSQKRRATHYAHNNKLEILWTTLPAIVLTFLIGKGLIVWNNQMNPTDDPNKITIELYARQFDWTARYAGKDNTLGDANYTMISDDNIVGILTPQTIEKQLAKCTKDLAELDSLLKFSFPNAKKYDDLKTAYRRKKFQLQRVIEFKNQIADKKFTTGNDDIILQQEIHIPVNRTISLKMRSQDVIHSAYMPNFRVHMYCVPGMTTAFTFVPTVTTAQMRSKLGNPNYDYLLYCNNICGAAHFNMQMKIIVDTQEDYDKWLKEQKDFYATLNPAPEAPAATEPAATDSTAKDSTKTLANK